jgi:hypothetical protein
MTGVAPEGGRDVAESLTLKPISKGAIPRALEKAERYRLLNDPEQAESICLDILAADPDEQRAVVMLILSITDRFGRSDASGLQRARAYVATLRDPYQRLYYEGLVREREARAILARPMRSSFAYDALRAAMEFYERASPMSPDDENEAILRWNACLRTIERAHLQPRPFEAEQPLE